MSRWKLIGGHQLSKDVWQSTHLINQEGEPWKNELGTVMPLEDILMEANEAPKLRWQVATYNNEIVRLKKLLAEAKNE